MCSTSKTPISYSSNEGGWVGVVMGGARDKLTMQLLVVSRLTKPTVCMVVEILEREALAHFLCSG